MLRSSYPLSKIEVSISHALFELLHSFTEVTATLILAISIIFNVKTIRSQTTFLKDRICILSFCHSHCHSHSRSAFCNVYPVALDRNRR
jgi:hypothetical protein